MTEIKVNTVFRVKKGNDWTLYVETPAHSDGRVLNVFFLPENIVRGVPDNRFDARVYRAIEKYGIEHITRETFMEIWNERTEKYKGTVYMPQFNEPPEWLKFEGES